MSVSGDSGVDAFIEEVRARLSRAFVAAFGIERAQEALAEAMAYSWEHHGKLRSMDNPFGYLYRVGQSRSRPRKRPIVFPPPAIDALPDIEPALAPALGALSERQRVCVVLVFALEWTHQEVADLLGLSRSSVQNHVERGLKQLQRAIGGTHDV